MATFLLWIPNTLRKARVLRLRSGYREVYGFREQVPRFGGLCQPAVFCVWVWVFLCPVVLCLRDIHTGRGGYIERLDGCISNKALRQS